MELRRSRGLSAAGIFLLPPGLVLLYVGLSRPTSAVGVLIIGGLCTLIGGSLLVSRLKPFRVHIGPEGLTLRRAGINGLVRWHEIGAVILEQPAPSAADPNPAPRLLLVPADRFSLDVPLEHRSPVDDRPCLVLLSFNDVMDSPEEVTKALARFGGTRYVDTRPAGGLLSQPDFLITLRGYDRGRVDELVGQGAAALASSSESQRRAVRAEIEAASFPFVMRGYDCRQVDAFLKEMAAELGSPSLNSSPPGSDDTGAS